MTKAQAVCHHTAGEGHAADDLKARLTGAAGREEATLREGGLEMKRDLLGPTSGLVGPDPARWLLVQSQQPQKHDDDHDGADDVENRIHLAPPFTPIKCKCRTGPRHADLL